MTIKMIRRTLLAAVVVGVLGAIGGTAYPLSSGNAGNGPSAASGEAALRDFLVGRLTAVGKPELGLVLACAAS